MSGSFPSEPAQRKSKQQASKNIASQSRKRPLEDGHESETSSFSMSLPPAIYGVPEDRGDICVPSQVNVREMITNAMLKTVSEMYFGTDDPFPEILRSMDDRIDPTTRRYVSSLETFLKSEVFDSASAAQNKKVVKEKIVITPLDMISCPFRQKEVVDKWTCLDVALFELGVCENGGFHPKRIHSIFEGRKSLDELVEFFEAVYSKSDNYRRIARLLSKEVYDASGGSSKSEDAEPAKSEQ